MTYMYNVFSGTFRRAQSLRPTTRMGDRLRRTNHLSISPSHGSHPSQLSLLTSVGRAIPERFREESLRPNSITLSWSQTSPKLGADLLARC